MDTQGQETISTDPQTNQTETAYTPEVKEPKKDTNLIVVASLGLFVIAALATVMFLFNQNQQLKKMLATYQVQPSPSPTTTLDTTADWKTYEDKKLAYSIKYPPTWTYKLGESYETLGLVLFDTNIQSRTQRGELGIIDYEFQISLEDEKNYSDWSQNTTQTQNLGKVVLGNQTLEKYIVGDLGYSLNYILKNEGKIYRFLIYPYEKEEVAPISKELMTEIEQTLSSLKFE